MAHPTAMQQLAKEREREVLETTGRARRPEVVHLGVRERLGWSLVGIGVHLALKGGRGGSGTDRWERATVSTSVCRTVRADG
ncbi:MAG TPA: hypothetical protein VN796_00630 [Acidimicrobiales bacterium]|nr:hypothetical protein [Acidimicrobiales bacterium]